MDSSDDDDILAVICALKLARKKKRKRKSIWVRDWISKGTIFGAYHSLLKELEDQDQRAYCNFLRMSRDNFYKQLQKVEPFIQKNDTHLREAIPAGEKLALTLRFLASGDSYGSLEFLYRIPRNTICNFIPEVCQAIWDVLRTEYVQVPDTKERWEQIQQEFLERWQFPNCIGAIDGKHITIKSPAHSGSEFYNYKKFFSIILLAMVDADYKIIFVDVGANGRAGDAAVYAHSELANILENKLLNIPAPKPLNGREMPVPSIVVGDDAFALKPYLMKPYPQKNLSDEKRIFNYRLSRTRRVSKNVFVILVSRFCIFKRPLEVSQDNAVKINLATVAQHNYLRSNADAVYMLHPSDKALSESSGTSSLQSQAGNRHAEKALTVRNELADYFMTDGQVPWQWNMI